MKHTLSIVTVIYLLLHISKAQLEHKLFQKLSQIHKYEKYTPILSEIIKYHPENFNSPENLFSIAEKAKSCPEGNKCCEELQRASRRYKLELLDASGTFREPGYKTSGFVPLPPLHSHNEYLASDGVQVQCQRIERNEKKRQFGGKYCLSRFVVSERDWPDKNISSVEDKFKLSTWKCVPDSCSAEKLNEFLEAEGSRTSYRYCLSTDYVYNWPEIVGWSLIGIWSLFLLFSPLKEIKIKNSLKFLGDFKQPSSAIKSIHGIRVLSLIWVCIGHVFVELSFSYSSNSLL